MPCFAAAVFLLGYVRSKNPDDIRITGFEPNSGPTSGGTTIRIEGRHFRSLFTEETADLQVKIGKSKLVVLSWQDDLIICRTEETSIEISSPIRVHFLPKPVTCPVYVSCKTPDKQIRQTTKHFELLKPNLVSFEPRITIGQRGKEINIVIIGKNLNIGNVRNATLWSGDCVEQTNDGSVMICKLQSFWDPKDMSETDRNTITVRIDGWTATLLGKVDGFIEIFGDYQKLLKKEGRSTGKILLILAIVVLTLIPVTIAIVYIIRRMIRDKADAASEHLSMGAIKPRDQPVYQSTVESRSEPVYQNTAGQTSERVSLMKAIDDADIASLQDVGKIIAMEHLTLKQEIGQGHFGTVFKGRLYDSKRDRTMDVAVKTVHEKGADAREISAFFQEALIMRDFEHPNILSLIGVAFTKDSMPLVVIPFMFNGNLR